MHRYFLHDGKETTGPFMREDLVARQAAGQLPADALIHDGTAWVAAAEFFNGAPGPAAAPTATTPVTPEQALQEALRQQPEPAPAVDVARWESSLFLCSFPVLIPSLLIMWVMAKRWGHIDIYLILIDGAILTGLGFLGGPWIGTLMLLSWISSVWLYWLRRDRRESGIFLGYSNLVAMLLVIGGALTIGGAIAVVPWGAIGRWNEIRAEPIPAKAERVRDRALPRGRRVELLDAGLDFDRAVKRRKEGGQWRFVSPARPVEKSGAPDFTTQLWVERKYYAGREIEFARAFPAGFSSVRNRVEVEEDGKKRWLEGQALHFALVAGSDRVWVATAGPLPPDGATVRGVTRLIYNEAGIGAAYAKAGRGNLPLMGLTIFDGEPAPAAAPAVEVPAAETETWVPAKEPAGSFWVRFPAGITPTGRERVAGFVAGGPENFPGLTALCVQMNRRGVDQVLYQQTADGYVAETKAREAILGGIAWKHAAWLGAGLLLLGGAAWRARYE